MFLQNGKLNMGPYLQPRRSESQKVSSKLHTLCIDQSHGSLIHTISVLENGSTVDDLEYPVSSLLVP